jgi:hypothetical protein
MYYYLFLDINGLRKWIILHVFMHIVLLEWSRFMTFWAEDLEIGFLFSEM